MNDLERIQGTDSVADGLMKSDRNFTRIQNEFENIDVSEQINIHDTNDKSHADIRQEIENLTSQTNQIATDQETHKADIVQTDEVNSSIKYPSAAVTYALGKEIDDINNNLALKQKFSLIKSYNVSPGETTVVPLSQYRAGMIYILIRGATNGSYIYHYHNWITFTSKVISEFVSTSVKAPTLSYDNTSKNLNITNSLPLSSIMDVTILDFTQV